MQNYSGPQYPEIDDLSSNSAHGPALDGRIIPHMVAPGCYVDSSLPGGYGLECGTSMASPHVSGAAALFIEYYRGITGEDPSPALIKAAFTVTAHDLAGNQDADGGTMGHPFDSKQGWGRMNTREAIEPSFSTLYYDNPAVLDNTGEIWERNVYPSDSGAPMRIMLVWTDAHGHGLGGSTPAWNNNLNLSVVVDGVTYLGNNFGGDGWSVAGGSTDGMNNTEGVFLAPPVDGSVTIRVTGANISSDGLPGVGDATDQDFSLVVVNAIDQSADGRITFSDPVYTSNEPATVQVSDLDLQGSGPISVTIYSDSEPGGETVMVTETESGSGILEGTIMLTESAGVSGELTVAHGDIITAEYYDEDTGSGSGALKTATAEVDLMPPIITGVDVLETGSDYAVITWTTSEPARPGIRYGDELPPQNQFFSGSTATDHSMMLTDLEMCTIYWFSAMAEDAAGNIAEDDAGGSYYLFLTDERIELINENMDVDPGWTVTGNWAWGEPAGQGGAYGNPDPDSGYTGTHVYGYNLMGDYTNNMAEYYLTTPSMDCSDGVGVTLSFQRWLGVETPTYDHARLQVSVNGGSTWNTVWENIDTMEGGSWEHVSYDLSGWADGEADVTLRWVMGPTDSGWVY